MGAGTFSKNKVGGVGISSFSKNKVVGVGISNFSKNKVDEVGNKEVFQHEVMGQDVAFSGPRLGRLRLFEAI